MVKEKEVSSEVRSRQNARIQKRMKRIIRGLKNKKYPLNKYEVKEVGGLFAITRVVGTRPHRKSKKAGGTKGA